MTFKELNKIKTILKVLGIRFRQAADNWLTNSNILNLIAILILSFAVYWIIEGPRLIVEPALKYTNHSKYDFRGTGAIGDTIGGITAPVIGLVSAILIYLSFNAQIKANKIIQQESNFRYILDEFEKIKKSFNKIKYSQSELTIIDPKSGKGHFAMTSLAKSIIETPELLYTEDHYPTESLSKADYTFTGYSIFVSEVTSLQLTKIQRDIIQKKIWLYHDEYMKYLYLINKWNISPPIASSKEKKGLSVEKCFRANSLKTVTSNIISKIEPFKESLNNKITEF